MSITPETLATSENYVRNFFLYTDPDNPAVLELFRIGVHRTAAALAQGWEMPDEDLRLARNLEYLKDNFEADEVDPKTLADSEAQLASFPDVYFRIREVLDDPASSAEDIARVVSSDMELTAKLLKLVNSPFYGLLENVADVAHAIALVGTEEVANLALGISAINVFKDIPPELMNMEVFWRHSVSCGVFARLIAQRVKGAKAEALFTAGLLHDAGRLIIYKKLPYASVQVLLHAREASLPLAEAENTVLGFNNAHVADLLLREWKFPAALVDAIANQHEPSKADDPVSAAIIQLAANLTSTMEVSHGGLYVLPGLEEGAWDKLGLTPDALAEIVELFDTHIDDLFKAFA